MNAILEAALTYHRAGFNVIATKEKVPVSGWQQWQTQRQSEDDVRAMFNGPDLNVGIITGQVSGLDVLDIDDVNRAWDIVNELCGHNPPTPIVHTPRGGLHVWFSAPGFALHNRAKLNGGSADWRGDGGLVVVPPSTGYRFDDVLGFDTPLAPIPDQLLGLLRQSAGNGLSTANGEGWTQVLASSIPEGQRNHTLTRVAGGLIGRGMPVDEALSVLEIVNDAKCKPPLRAGELGQIVVSISKAEKRGTYGANNAYSAPIQAEAFHGLVGEVVRAFEPHTEACPAALLVQLLAILGNLIGDGPHVLVEDARHPARLFVGLIGETSVSRKGTALGRVMHFASLVDPEFTKKNVATGLSSGEGLIWAVRDPVEKCDESGAVTVVDSGVVDKRLIVLETEIGSPLRVLKREGNTLSPVMRSAWDDGNLRVLTRHSPIAATGAHISLVMHGTVEELKRYLAEAEIFGGWANRILWIMATRTRLLPFGGQPDSSLLEDLAARVRSALADSQHNQKLGFDDQAAALWVECYPDLSLGRLGLVGLVTSRATAQIMRLALCYALLDCSPVIREPHLTAALAVWEYADQSAAKIFGDQTGDRDANAILEALRLKGSLTRTEIRDLFSRHLSRERTDTALATLAETGLAQMSKTSTAGRPIETWRIGGDKSAISAISECET